jgi:acetyltransferase-like isoleucine patch superfamily enzyme
MHLDFLRRSAGLPRRYSWLNGTRCRRTGQGHRIAFHNARLFDTSIEISGRDCELVISPGARLWGCTLKVAGNGARLHIGADCRLRHTTIIVEDDASRLLIGDQTTMIGPTLLSQEGRLIQVGYDCLIAKDTELRNSDSHTILDSASGHRLNPPADVIIGDHVWLGLGCYILKGTRIGAGTIVAARSLVTGELPAGCLALGSPTKPVRGGIHWKHTRASIRAVQLALPR